MKAYQHRFMRLPRVEQQRLLHLVEYIGKGHKLDESVLKGFPQESIDILDGMFKARLEEDRYGSIK